MDGVASLNNAVDHLIESAQQDTYQLSMLLIVSALLNSHDHYSKVLVMLTTLLDDHKSTHQSNAYLAWLYGRVVFAAKRMQDDIAATRASERLKTLLADTQEYDAFSCWAKGYLAGFNLHEYESEKKSLRYACQAISAVYLETKAQADLSNAIWGWVMCITAAAAAGDNSLYEDALSQIQKLTQQDSIPAALASALIRSSSTNDYPAWALAMLRAAAARHGDKQLYAELEQPVMIATQDAHSANATYEYLLAYLTNAQLA